jgi:hypothetical protein
MELTACQPSGTDNLAAASGYFKNSGTLVHIPQFLTSLHCSTDGDSGIYDDMFNFFRIFPIRKLGAPQSLSGTVVQRKTLPRLEQKSSSLSQPVAKTLSNLQHAYIP